MTELTLSAEELAGYLSLTPRHVRRLADAGILQRTPDGTGFHLKPSISGYIDYLRKRMGKSAEELELQRAKIRRTNAVAAIEEMRSRKLSGELVPREVVVN